jgi:rare lipoprotein A
MEGRVTQLKRATQSILLLCLVLALWGIAGCAGRPAPRGDYPPGYPIGYVERGVASWYGPGFHGNNTANGERYDMHQLTAAHRTLPLGCVATVRSLSNGRRVTVRINDRGPFASGFGYLRVQVASFAEPANAQSLVGRLKRQYSDVRMVTADLPSGRRYRVQVGQFMSERQAEAVAERLESQFAVESLVVRDDM